MPLARPVCFAYGKIENISTEILPQLVDESQIAILKPGAYFCLSFSFMSTVKMKSITALAAKTTSKE